MDRLLVLVIALVLAAGGCSGGGSVTPAPSVGPSAVASPSGSAWAQDLAQLDHFVRTTHVSPFTVHSEAEWTAQLAKVSGSIETATPNQQIALVASLVGLLDTHSGFFKV